MSVTVALPSDTVVSGPVACIDIAGGAVIVGTSPDMVIVTSCAAVAIFPDASFAVHVTVVGPGGNPPDGALLVTVG